MALELTIQQACKHPFNFVYIWADEDKYLKRINPKYAAVIRTKKANQNKLIRLSADKYGKSISEYTSAIREAFINTFNMTPADALLKLAKGETVEGKNFAQGVFGVGKTKGVTFTQNSTVTVDKKTGHILVNGQDTYDPNDEYACVYGSNAVGKTVAVQYFYTAPDGTSYSSQRDGLGRYYAANYTDTAGNMQDAFGNAVSDSDAGTVWETSNMNWEWLDKILNWLLSLFNLSSSNTTETLNPENTLPNQKNDGYVQESGFGEAAIILLALAAGGTLIAGGFGKKKSK